MKRGSRPSEFPPRLPALGLRDLVYFPTMVLPLLVGRPRSVAALEEAEEQEGLLLLVAQRDPDADEPAASDLHRVGTRVRIVQSTPLSDGTVRVVFEGIDRVEVRRFLPGPGPFRAEVSPFPYEDEDQASHSPEQKALIRTVERGFREYVHLHPDLPEDIAAAVAEVEDPVRLAHMVGGHLPVAANEKQEVLEAATLQETFEALRRILDRELEVVRIEDRLGQEMRRQMDQDRRQHYLQEQLRAIQKELGEGDPEWADLEGRLSGAELPDHTRERADREFERLKRLNPISPEAGVIRGYLEWIAALPWARVSDDNLDVGHARTVLEEAHYGLDEVKDRILDHIAVLSLVGRLQGPILCLVGPPGVGKTSLGRSISRALGREFVRISLGGVRDEAEIRGHRRTYVGSLPGRILQGMRRAGTRNPVFLLDEVDKLARDGHGDPAAALLEVLDPEQNRTFQDHYLELDFDLSDVLFVATANTLAGIPEPLQDRMEIIRIPGYLETEKKSIARRFLVPSQMNRHGLDPDRVRIEGPALERIIEDYTREAGVRELDRCLARISRKLARDVAGGDRKRDGVIQVTDDALGELLGPPPHFRAGLDRGKDRVGIATGLAWTSVGGETLEVEVAAVPGSGRIQLTGTLGDVMKESAVAGVTFARARAGLLGLSNRFHREVDLHIHIPEGATPKDGPSAGITIAAALVSALTGVPTRPDVALTGEITLRGRVLPVGGIKEKAVAAVREGIRTVVIPAGNEPELQLLPEEIRGRLEFRPVERMDEVLELILDREVGVVSPDTEAVTDFMGGSH
jgi:ATP-dependent Lon protease